jgi:hypothetical protein
MIYSFHYHLEFAILRTKIEEQNYFCIGNVKHIVAWSLWYWDQTQAWSILGKHLTSELYAQPL